MIQNYYKTLGVSKEASSKEIRKAYHTLALKNHPDKNPGSQALNQRFAEINSAYEILKDSKTRAAYDLQYNDSSEEFETLIEIIIYVSNCGIAYIKTEMKKLVTETKKLVVSVSKSVALSAKNKAQDQYEKLIDKGAELFDKLAKKVGEKYQDVKEVGANMLDQATHKAHDQYEILKDKSVKALGNWKHSAQEKVKNMFGVSLEESKVNSPENQNPTVSEELHPHQDKMQDGLNDA